ncbi:unnamed protein product [Caenorhabditis nigoni]
MSTQKNSHYQCDELRMKAIHVKDTMKVVRNPWGLLEDGLREARRLIEAEQSEGGWGSADIKLLMPTQSRTHGTTKLGLDLERHGPGLIKNWMLMINKYQGVQLLKTRRAEREMEAIQEILGDIEIEEDDGEMNHAEEEDNNYDSDASIF